MTLIIMIFFFTFFSSSSLNKNPIVLVPGLYGSNLYAKYEKVPNIPWYCPKKMDDELLYIHAKFLIPPLYNCIAYLSQTIYDNESRQVHNLPNVKIGVRDFGGEGSVDYVIKSSSKIQKYQGDISFTDRVKQKLTIKYYDSFYGFIQYYIERGYTVGEDFFAAPYDWRIAPLFVDDYWRSFRQLIENAYEKSNGQKVTLIGFSMGCFMIQQFLSSEALLNKSSTSNTRIPPIKNIKDIITDEWKEKYIEKVVMLAPSFGGSFKSFDAVFGHFTTLIPEIRNKYFTNMSTSLPSFHSHFPNHQIFDNIPLVRGPDGQNYTARDLTGLVLNHSVIRKEDADVMNVCIDSIQSEVPFDIGENIPLSIVYNTKVNTLSFIDFQNGWDQEPNRTFLQNGDGTVQAEGPKFLCNNWKTENRSLLCIDLNNSDEVNFVHSALPQNNLVQQLLFNLTTRTQQTEKDNWWMRKGKSEIIISSTNDHLNSECFEL